MSEGPPSIRIRDAAEALAHLNRELDKLAKKDDDDDDDMPPMDNDDDDTPPLDNDDDDLPPIRGGEEPSGYGICINPTSDTDFPNGGQGTCVAYRGDGWGPPSGSPSSSCEYGFKGFHSNDSCYDAFSPVAFCDWITWEGGDDYGVTIWYSSSWNSEEYSGDCEDRGGMLRVVRRMSKDDV